VLRVRASFVAPRLSIEFRGVRLAACPSLPRVLMQIKNSLLESFVLASSRLVTRENSICRANASVVQVLCHPEVLCSVPYLPLNLVFEQPQSLVVLAPRDRHKVVEFLLRLTKSSLAGLLAAVGHTSLRGILACPGSCSNFCRSNALRFGLRKQSNYACELLIRI